MKKILLLITTFFSIITVQIVTPYNDSIVGNIYTDIMAQVELIPYLNAKYSASNRRNVSSYLVQGSTVQINMENASQSNLNNYYQAMIGDFVNGTCAIVASTLFLQYYDNQNLLTGRGSQNLNKYDFFIEMMQDSLNAGLTTETNGTHVSDVDDILTLYLNSIDSGYIGDNESNSLCYLITLYTGANLPLILHLPGHSVVARGHNHYITTYEEEVQVWWWKEWRTFSVSTNFIIISEGWYNSGVSYYDATLIQNQSPYAITRIIEG